IQSCQMRLTGSRNSYVDGENETKSEYCVILLRGKVSFEPDIAFVRRLCSSLHWLESSNECSVSSPVFEQSATLLRVREETNSVARKEIITMQDSKSPGFNLTFPV